MKLNTKTTLFSSGLMLIMLVVLIAVSLLSFRQFSIISAEEHAKTAAEMVRVGLTEMMVNGVIDKRKQLLSRISTANGLSGARVVRGPEVASQFGEGLIEERPQDEIESRVLVSGKPFYGLIDVEGEPLFRSTIPFVATGKGEPNCLACHQVAEGTVLGAVTITMSIAHLKQSALLTVAAMSVAVALFAVMMIVLFRRMTRPLVKTASDVQHAVDTALLGDFTTRIECLTNDEIGDIAERFNQLSDFLDAGLGDIRDNVAQLIRCKPSGNENMLTNTTMMVDGLVAAAQFKQAIEEDESKAEVYQRLVRVLQESFYLERFSIYEVAASKNRMYTVSVDSDESMDCRWCDPQILIRSETCRARRTGHTIDSIGSPQICNAFHPGEGNENLEHICIPVIQSGTVGSVVQMVIDQEAGADYQQLVPMINVYLREAAPVIEAKRLMDTLRESTMRDAMTGLHNRRFLEEYVETLVSSNARRDSDISILMLDLDYFKKVNDTYGHDAGDTVLKEISKVMKKVVRAADLVIRYGGEEFMILLQETAGEKADEVAEKIRAAVEELKVQLPGNVLQKTISIGVSSFPDDSETFWQAVKYADVALYKAKEQGRNRVVHFKPEMWTDEEDY
ncbi:diguanylate cyclase [Solemya pervernicosa gill symbiont]|uniref:diguanylate cyclase n=2 Tax=Gammaproteobacteria incertae sedis TaxID=118884 RepID=A0A1T2L1S6_9GAMM|nr:diguanylate cyclase [Solemya pervernicosa gill symbiont]OOZ39045.1 diguanylate cyclase [Solemya pervernicosa gill symbiont]